MSSIYTEKWVLFLDILGFEAYVNDEKKSEEFARKVLRTFKELTKVVKEMSKVVDRDIKDKHKFIEVSQFSDTFIISSTTFAAVRKMAIIIQLVLLEENLLSRGAITYGKVFHNGSQFIGPAITRAYNLEKSEALYPRVIIDPECEALKIKGSKKVEISRKDFDGYLYVDFLYDREANYDYLISNINELYEEHKNTKHRGKYTWLKQKADEFIQNTK
jgi:transcription antitermination factor NusG